MQLSSVRFGSHFQFRYTEPLDPFTNIKEVPQVWNRLYKRSGIHRPLVETCLRDQGIGCADHQKHLKTPEFPKKATVRSVGKLSDQALENAWWVQNIELTLVNHKGGEWELGKSADAMFITGVNGFDVICRDELDARFAPKIQSAVDQYTSQPEREAGALKRVGSGFETPKQVMQKGAKMFYEEYHGMTHKETGSLMLEKQIRALPNWARPLVRLLNMILPAPSPS